MAWPLLLANFKYQAHFRILELNPVSIFATSNASSSPFLGFWGKGCSWRSWMMEKRRWRLYRWCQRPRSEWNVLGRGFGVVMERMVRWVTMDGTRTGVGGRVIGVIGATGGRVQRVPGTFDSRCGLSGDGRKKRAFERSFSRTCLAWWSLL